VSLPAILSDAEIGHRIFFDDGLVETKVLKKKENKLELIVLKTSKDGFKLKSRKGINLPDTKLNLPSLTTNDIENIPFVMQHADIVGYSFVRTVEDIKALHQEIEKYDRDDLGLVLKIENQESFENLPILLLEAMKKSKVGVMIARGDLAVEIGAERIAEVQDEIMWICEAAHVPVIWATQVLENLAKTGKATRAEITDAAKSARAECVMLNKGPYIDDAVKMLSNILTKMEGHTSKKKSVMRSLKVSQANIDRMGNS
jgi:pyruvate kinase